jgi:hypothetical protein
VHDGDVTHADLPPRPAEADDGSDHSSRHPE